MNPNAPIYLYGVFPMRAKYFVLLLGTFEFLMTLQNSGGLHCALGTFRRFSFRVSLFKVV